MVGGSLFLDLWCVYWVFSSVSMFVYLAKFEGDDQWYSVLKKSYWNPGSTLIAKLKCNMKTTKPKGKNRVRNLHTCPNSKFACLSMWLNRVIDARLFPYKHLLRDSLHLVDQLRNERLPVGWAMIRIDLDHFHVWD